MNMIKLTTLALVAGIGLTGCMGTKHLSQNISDDGRISSQDDIVFPQLDKAWQKDGQFPNSENLSKIRAGVSKDELYQLIGRPHFSEAQKAREWDYILKFYQADNSVKICQYKVIFDKDYKGQEFYWLPADCANYAKPSSAHTAMTPVVANSVVGVQLHHDNFGLGADALFDFDKWQLSHMKAEGRGKLNEIATQILAHGDKIGQIVITGYTDRLGDEMYNMNLSMLRAQTVREYLISKGVNPAQIIATGGGKSMPVKECSNKQSHQSLINCLEPNRRVEVSVSYYK
ncbi:OmpA family protein [Moraxella sp. VT-16-12]|uniref:OmpA family protein n=1 Tax=Moraxella sp. VT-16-12 TaxID=2014877 RepID=UPI000B7CA4AB|nr:OmpA family protein [Moraxella sp. VT-16-12]TWV82909.1 OmpA family protein [Moraxella sp. VT-16-12]